MKLPSIILVPWFIELREVVHTRDGKLKSVALYSWSPIHFPIFHHRKTVTASCCVPTFATSGFLIPPLSSIVSDNQSSALMKSSRLSIGSITNLKSGKKKVSLTILQPPSDTDGTKIYTVSTFGADVALAQLLLHLVEVKSSKFIN